MKSLRFTLIAFLLTTLVSLPVLAQMDQASAITLTEAQISIILGGDAAAKAEIKAALLAANVDITDLAGVKAAVAAIVAQVSTVSGIMSEGMAELAAQTAAAVVVELAAATPGADVTGAATAASAGAVVGAVTGVKATGGDINAAAKAAARGAITGAVTAAKNVFQSMGIVEMDINALARSAAQAATDSALDVGASAQGVALVASNTASANSITATVEIPESYEGAETSFVISEDFTLDVPGDNLSPVKFQTFTLVLSYGNFSVTINDANGDVLVVKLAGQNTVGPPVSSNNGSINDLAYPAGITLSNVQQANLDTGLTVAATAANDNEVVTVVPDNTVVVVSPSS